jgi:hypothetical protein
MMLDDVNYDGYISMYSTEEEQFNKDFTPDYSFCAATHIHNPCLDMSKKRYKKKDPLFSEM